MKRRPISFGPPSAEDEPLGAENGGVREITDPDPTVNFPQWARSLLLLLDYAIIEGLQHRLVPFVQYLKLAEEELSKVAANSGDHENAGDEGSPPAKTH